MNNIEVILPDGYDPNKLAYQVEANEFATRATGRLVPRSVVLLYDGAAILHETLVQSGQPFWRTQPS